MLPSKYCKNAIQIRRCAPPTPLLVCQQVAYSSPISPKWFGPLAAVFVMSGLAIMSISFVQQMNARKEQSVMKDLPLVLTSSALLGFGSLFVLLWSGVYV